MKRHGDGPVGMGIRCQMNYTLMPPRGHPPWKMPLGNDVD